MNILALQSLLFHQPPMRFIESILTINQDTIHCQLKIRKNSLFYDAAIKGVYAWFGIEFMAQSIAAFATSQNQQQPQLGLLLSVRNFKSQQAYFALNEQLQIIAHREYLQDNVGVFHCECYRKVKMSVLG